MQSEIKKKIERLTTFIRKFKMKIQTVQKRR